MLRYEKRNDTKAGFERPEDMPEALHALLEARGVDSAEAAERFLHPGPGDLWDPMMLGGMADAVAVIRGAMAAGEPICVYGDYDVDGVCASSILLLWLRANGADARVYLPSRHSEGYGLNEAAIREIAGWAKLLVTVDCGVTSVELVKLAKELGLRVVVTDHHEPGEALPECPVVNPLLAGYPFPYLCGAGVAWKLVWALGDKMPVEYVDIAALATVADVVSLTGENRAIVRMGLDAINRGPRPGVAALIEVSGLAEKRVTSSNIAFQLAPRLNAGGRLGSAMRALELVTAEDLAAARPLAQALDGENAKRRAIEQQIMAEAEARLQSFDFAEHRAIILAGKDWNPGVIGLAASRLVERYHYPVILLADQGEKLTGSCRSIEGVDIHAALCGCADVIQRFGGHKQAAGLTLEPEKLDEFIRAMDAWLEANIAPEVYVPVKLYDAEVGLDTVTAGLVAALEGLEPVGFGNPGAVFRARATVLEARAVGVDGAHLKLTLAGDGRRIGGIAFREGAMAERFSGGECRADVLFTPNLNTYMGRTEVQMQVRALSEDGAGERIASKLGDEAALQCDFLTEILYNKKIDAFWDGAGIAPAEISDVARWFAEKPQGALAVTGDLAAASRLASALPEGGFDLYFGELPADARAFNAVCVLPGGGEIPAGYRRIALMGVPGAWALGRLPEGAALYRLEDHPAWTRCLPDIDGMRDTYRALAALGRRPVVIRDLMALAGLAAEEAGQDVRCAMASILAMLDMGLFGIEWGAGSMRLIRLDRKSADPDESNVWRAIQRLREGAL